MNYLIFHITNGELFDLPSPDYLNIMLVYKDERSYTTRVVGEWKEGPKALFTGIE